jgi:hypothetical protein
MDGVAKRITDDEADWAAMGHQIHRHERWIGQLAEATNAKLMPKPLPADHLPDQAA